MIYKLKKCFILSNLTAAVGSFSLLDILFLQKIQNENIYQVISIVIGMLFWLSLLTEFLLIWKTGSCRKSMEKKSNQKPNRKNVGIISFMKTPIGRIVDTILFLLVIVLLLLVCEHIDNSKIVIPVLAALYFTFHLHCLYNGRNYLYLRRYLKHNKEK